MCKHKHESCPTICTIKLKFTVSGSTEYKAIIHEIGQPQRFSHIICGLVGKTNLRDFRAYE